MNTETSSQHSALLSSGPEYTTSCVNIQLGNHRDSPSPPLLETFLPALLSQARKDRGGLSAIPQSTLRDNLQLVVTALEKLDAEALLDLTVYPTQQHYDKQPGPRIREG
jgi:hypothetical protein